MIKTKIELLKQMNYISNKELSQKGIFASRVYGYELLLTELFASGILEKLESIEINIVLVSLCFEPRKHQLHTRLPEDIVEIRNKIMPIFKQIRRIEKRSRIYPFSKKPYFNLGQSIKYWSNGESLAKAKAQSEADEGEIVRYFRMVIQLLRQLQAIKFITPGFRQRIKHSLSLINRNEVDAEKQLREGI